MATNLIFMGITLLALVLVGFFMSLSIKKHDARKQHVKKKKGKMKYMQQSKNPGR